MLSPRLLMTDVSGTANMSYLESDQRRRFHFTPAGHYAYSNEGIWILQTVLEQGLQLDIGAEMQTRVFDRFGMTRTSMQWRDDFASNLADGYMMDGAFEPPERRDNVAAAGSMGSTIKGAPGLWPGRFSCVGALHAARQKMVPAPAATVPPDEWALDTGLAPGVGGGGSRQGAGKGARGGGRRGRETGAGRA